MKARIRIWIYPFVITSMILILVISCKKKEENNLFETGTVTDIEGNAYKTVKIGTQWWMAENLNTTKYRNGDPIPNVYDGGEWRSLTTGAYCNYNNDVNIASTYGRLYNWYAVTDNRNIAPSGWHVPTNDEWALLITFLGGEGVACNKLKEKGNDHWKSFNSGATNETGFTAIPGGCRDLNPLFKFIGEWGMWWSFSENDKYSAWLLGMNIFGDIPRDSHNKYEGLSLRCVRDN